VKSAISGPTRPLVEGERGERKGEKKRRKLSSS